MCGHTDTLCWRKRCDLAGSHMSSNVIFTVRLHICNARYSHERNVYPSVRQTRELWQNERNLCPHFILHEKPFILVIWQEEWLVGATHSTWNFGSTGPRWSEIADFKSIFASSASAVTPSEKSSINANRKSFLLGKTRFPMSLKERKKRNLQVVQFKSW